MTTKCRSLQTVKKNSEEIVGGDRKTAIILNSVYLMGCRHEALARAHFNIITQLG